MADRTVEVSRSDRWRKLARSAAPFFVLAALYLAIGGFEPNFFRWASVRALLEQWPVILMLSAGQMLVVMTGRIDLSNASLASLAAMLTVLWLPHLGPVTILLVLLMTTGIGLVQGLLHYHAQVASFVITLGGLGAFSGLALAISGGHSVLDDTKTMEFLYERTLAIPNVAYIAVAIVLIVAAFMRWLPMGRAILAVGNGQLAAAYSGVRVGRVMATVFAASGLFAGLCGLAIVGWVGAASPKTADNLMLPALAAVIIGGTAITGGLGGIGRTVLGALIMAVLRVGLDVAGIPAMYQPIIYGALVVLAVGLTIDRTRLKIVK